MNSTASHARARAPLATWLFVGAMGATIAAVLTCTLVIDRFVRDEDRRQATQYLQAHADALRDALDRGMAHHYEEVNVIALLDQVACSSDPHAVRSTL
jgi:3-hydroxyacyl-CoA dehydrogenase